MNIYLLESEIDGVKAIETSESLFNDSIVELHGAKYRVHSTISKRKGYPVIKLVHEEEVVIDVYAHELRRMEAVKGDNKEFVGYIEAGVDMLERVIGFGGSVYKVENIHFGKNIIYLSELEITRVKGETK